MHTQKNYYFLLAKFTAEDLELLRLFEIESAANYLQRIEEEKRTGTEERVRRTSERWIEFLVVKVLSGDQFEITQHFRIRVLDFFNPSCGHKYLTQVSS